MEHFRNINTMSKFDMVFFTPKVQIRVDYFAGMLYHNKVSEKF